MGISQHNATFTVGFATPTVKDVLRAVREGGHEWPLPEDMDDAARPT